MISNENAFRHFELTSGELELAEQELSQFRMDTATRVDDAIKDARACWLRAMPARVIQAVSEMGIPNGPAAITIDNLPFDASIDRGLLEPSTTLAPKHDRISEALALGAAAILGEPYGISMEGDGVINNLCPTRAARRALTGLGSERTLGLHIENAALRRHPLGICPDGLVLVGVSGDPRGNPPTFVADARRALGTVSDRVRAHLERPYQLMIPERWRRAMMRDHVIAPVVVRDERDLSFAFAFYGDMVQALDQERAEALADFESALQAEAVPLEITPGAMVMIDNRIAAHGRGAFLASFTEDGVPRRWVQRVFWTRWLARFACLRETAPRVFAPGSGG